MNQTQSKSGGKHTALPRPIAAVGGLCDAEALSSASRHCTGHFWRLAMKSIICPNVNCGYRGRPERRSRGSWCVALVLCLFFLLPGIWYCAARSGYRWYCPSCGVQIGSDS